MRNNRTFLFDEVSEAKKEYEDTRSPLNYWKVELVAKYMYSILGYRGEKLEQELIDYCRKKDPTFNPDIHFKELARWQENAKKYNLRKIDSITITENEYNFLKNIEEDKDRQCLFYALIIAKAVKQGKLRRKNINTEPSPNYYIKYRNLQDVARFANLRLKDGVEVAKIFHKYIDNFYIYPPDKQLIKLLYAEADGVPYYTITDFTNLQEEYKKIFQDLPLHTCIICKKPIEKTSNSKKYCNECSKKIRNEKQKELMKKRRNEKKQ